MQCFNATYTDFEVLLMDIDGEKQIYPLVISNNGDILVKCVSPLHGRSFVVGQSSGRYIISKGNGLSYSQYPFLCTQELLATGDDTWGLLLEQDARRDFLVGQEIEGLGIKTNKMEYVLRLDTLVTLPNGHKLTPILLQYSVENPYRICDAPFMEQSQIMSAVEKWEQLNTKGFPQRHLIAADVLIGNLRTMHDNGILHNAIHEQNYTWALELLDFELARTPNHPYAKEDYERHVPSLYSREVMHTYVIINYIAWVLKEDISYSVIDGIFADYGYDLSQYGVSMNKNL